MSVSITVEARNAQVIAAEIDEIPKRARPGVMRSMFERLAQVRERVTWYPPELPDQKYQRTGTYGRGFKIFRIEGAGGGIANAQGWVLQGLASQRGRVYTQYVGGDAEGGSQAEIHQGRWRTIHGETLAALDALEEDVGNAVANALVRRGRFE